MSVRLEVKSFGKTSGAYLDDNLWPNDRIAVMSMENFQYYDYPGLVNHSFSVAARRGSPRDCVLPTLQKTGRK